MPQEAYIRVDATVVIAGDPSWSVRWVDGFVEIATGRVSGSITVGTGIRLELDQAAYTALSEAMKQAATDLVPDPSAALEPRT